MARTFLAGTRGGWSLLAGLVAGSLLGVFIGCGTPQERYKTLSKFFDGVPDPDNPDESLGRGRGRKWDREQTGSAHKPWSERKCSECHPNRPKRNRGNIIPEVSMSGSLAAWNQCGGCHADAEKVGEQAVVLPKGAWLHGPVAAGQCRVCHLPHRSRYPSLLREEKIEKTCRSCHETIGARAGAMAELDCSSCHDPHFSNSKDGLFLSRFGARGCGECHLLDKQTRPWIHGPVTVGSCTVCHDAHGQPGSERHVFRPIAKVCHECHVAADLTPMHREEKTAGQECDSCHVPHAASSADDLFLRDRIKAAGIVGPDFHDPRKKAEPDAEKGAEKAENKADAPNPEKTARPEAASETTGSDVGTEDSG